MVFFTLCCTASSGFFFDNTTTTKEIDSTGLPRLVLSVSRAHCVLFLQQHHGDTMRVLLWSIPFSRYHGGTNLGRTSSSYVIKSYYDQAPLDEYDLALQILNMTLYLSQPTAASVVERLRKLFQ
ncbi:hypothetical protein JHK87_001569 [Glycine soja]|nr:hypothetical protein JHK87_001569 [Glycine soja]